MIKNYKSFFKSIQDYKKNPGKYKGSIPPIDPVKNTQAGHDYLKWTYEQFEKNMTA